MKLLSIRKQFGIPKSGDLLWRLLHHKVAVGRELQWIPEPQQERLILGIGFTIAHIWLDCTVPEVVWEEVGNIWAWITSTPVGLPWSVSGFIVLLKYLYLYVHVFVSRRICNLIRRIESGLP